MVEYQYYYRTIEGMLKNTNARLSTVDKWLVWGGSGEWEVYLQPYHKQVQLIYIGNDLIKALKVLQEEAKQ